MILSQIKTWLSIISIGIGGLAIYEVAIEHQFWQGGILLVCVGLIVFTTLKKMESQKLVDVIAQKSVEEKILATIREKGQAKRRDLMNVTGLSRSSLGRLLDEMEKRGLIEQQGERKTSFYTLKMAERGQNL